MAATRKAKAVTEPDTTKTTADILEQTKTESDEIKPAVRRDVDPHEIVVVRNGFNGILVYISKKTGEKFVWDSLGDEQEMEVGELRQAKNSSKAFFINNWFMFDEEYQWVIDYIGARMYYKNAIGIDNLDELFSLSAEEIEDRVSKLSQGQRQSLIYMAREKEANGEIDSRKVTSALEKSLGISLTDK